jgi:hypothetical protein
VRTETAAHLAARLPRKTRPQYFARFAHVPNYGSAAEYPFGADFASAPIAAETRQKLLCLESIDGAFAQVFPEQGRASVGSIDLTLTNASDLPLFYLSARAAHLAVAMTPTVPGAGQFMTFDDPVFNIPAAGTLEITTGGVIERVRYTGLDAPSTTIEVVARGVDGTTAADHAIGDEAVNGEQIRPGQRCQLYAGYADINEADFMPFCKMEVVGRRLHEDGQAFVIELADIQRSLRREVFLTASAENPIALEGEPFTLVLQLLTSTGTGTNGPYDSWPEHYGLGIPQAYIDITAIETTAALVAAPNFRFSLQAPVTAKDWIEREVLQVLNCYPVVTQDGKYTIKRFGGYRA